VRCHVAAETLPALADRSVDLITAAQALHWFDPVVFAAEARRVAAAAAVVAAWSYGLPRVCPAVDAVLDRLYTDLDPWWPPERRHVDDRYSRLGLPGTPVVAPPFAMVATWDLAHLRGYLASWSAVAACRAATGGEPVDAVAGDLASAWEGAGQLRAVRWPLTVLCARI